MIEQRVPLDVRLVVAELEAAVVGVRPAPDSGACVCCGYVEARGGPPLSDLDPGVCVARRGPALIQGERLRVREAGRCAWSLGFGIADCTGPLSRLSARESHSVHVLRGSLRLVDLTPATRLRTVIDQGVLVGTCIEFQGHGSQRTLARYLSTTMKEIENGK